LHSLVTRRRLEFSLISNSRAESFPPLTEALSLAIEACTEKYDADHQDAADQKRWNDMRGGFAWFSSFSSPIRASSVVSWVVNIGTAKPTRPSTISTAPEDDQRG